MRCENPRGEYGVYLVSKGGNTAVSPAASAAPASATSRPLKHMTVGHYVADAVTILGSLDIVLCEVDR